jgi:hypothetical protein
MRAPSSAAATLPDGVNFSCKPLSILLSPCARPELGRSWGAGRPTSLPSAGEKTEMAFERKMKLEEEQTGSRPRDRMIKQNALRCGCLISRVDLCVLFAYASSGH